MAVITSRVEANHAWRQALTQLARLLYGLGWVAAKTLWLVLGALAGLLFGAGWLCARAVPAGRWVASAVAIGWETGRGREAGGTRARR